MSASAKESRGEGLLETAERTIEGARRQGASAADIMVTRSTDFEVKVADGAIITLSQATSKGLGLRVFVDGRLGFCTTSDFNPDALGAAVGRAVALAREAAVDPHNGLAEAQPGELSSDGLDLFDPTIPALPPDTKIAWAHELERAARAVDKRVCKFRDSGVSSSEADTVLLTSAGALRRQRSTAIGLWCNPIAEEDGQMQTEVWYDTKTHLADLEALESVGRTAGERAVRMLGAKAVRTQDCPVIFEPGVAASLLAGLLPALNGDMVYKRASFLCDRLGAQIAAASLSVIDDPLLARGVGSASFDGEGLATSRKRVIDAGRLTTFLYDSYTARKAGTAATANARRSQGSLPRPGAFNLLVAEGNDDLRDLSRCERALIVTRGLGSGLNPVSGEYSRGVNGLWVEHGEVVHPVQEVTIAGDFLDMLQKIDAVGSDFRLCGSVGAPSLRIASMTVSGA
jgi:PmbA protein